ncbi:hypothetical protein DSL72_000518 [Monilinia vaccinii-corymbosi]|uniref:Peptidase S8/S53 domain-containing protein n=1 Tax=Monilinia vaccinii-corymbosi TaxID=61207 RepID=A0A8A3P9L7_9HELO|nr:hypothetical protein DSL72_000518 [Monilinia vaccinii-corymbosi]
MPDSTTNSMSDTFVQESIINKFEIEKFDWRKLDVNLDILTSSSHADHFTELVLYSSGNWSVLYHWLSDDGLAKLRKLEEVTINIINLNPSEHIHDQLALKRHTELVTKYKAWLEKSHDDSKRPGYKFTLKIEENAEWDFPVVQYRENEEPFVPKLDFLDQLKPSLDYLDQLNKSPEDGEERERFEELTNKPPVGTEDKRIKIAIIDNGVDRIRTNWASNTTLVDDIARVGKGSKDILPADAAKQAIEWALEQRVDIISMSWVTKKNYGVLQHAVKIAVEGTKKDNKRQTLLFCSTADEGAYSGEIWPAMYDKTVRIAATDRYGHMRPTSDPKNVNTLVPGEDIEADGPSYMEKYIQGTVSGSSVATALAAGIASLALLLIKTFNDVSDEDWNYFHEKDGILAVFKKMESDQMGVHTGVVLSNLFPGNDLKKGLSEKWNINNLKHVEPSK